MSGGFNPSPRRFGRAAGQPDEILTEALVEADGTALSDDPSSFVYAEHLAEGRAIAYLYELRERLANQWDPLRMSDFLPRWERIYGIFVPPGVTESQRRQVIYARQQAEGRFPQQQVITDMLTTALGSVFVGLVTTPSSSALGSVPGGCTVPGGVTLPDGDWISSIAYLAIQVTQPAGMTDAQFYGIVGMVTGLLDDVLPGWVTFAWFRDGSMSGEFILDDPHNLDNERLGT